MQLNATQRDKLWHLLTMRPQVPEGRDGDLYVETDSVAAGETHCVVSLRDAIFSGKKPTTVCFDEDVLVRTMRHNGGIWMSDCAQEVYQMLPILDRLRHLDQPRLLIGGLGLGVFSKLADQYAGARVTTIENDERIIRMISPHVPGEVVHADIFDYARVVEQGQFDVAFLDTWQSTGETSWVEQVVPLRRILTPQVDLIYCWQENEMAGQIRMHAPSQVLAAGTQNVRVGGHYMVLREAALREGILRPDTRMDDLWELSDISLDQDFGRLVSRFLRFPGHDAWESEFGDLWDEYVGILRDTPRESHTP